jgi:hypothetical protein
MQGDEIPTIGRRRQAIAEGYVPGRSHGPEPVPQDTDSACVLESDVPIVVQHTRLDSRQAESALLSTTAFSRDA